MANKTLPLLYLPLFDHTSQQQHHHHSISLIDLSALSLVAFAAHTHCTFFSATVLRSLDTLPACTSIAPFLEGMSALLHPILPSRWRCVAMLTKSFRIHSSTGITVAPSACSRLLSTEFGTIKSPTGTMSPSRSSMPAAYKVEELLALRASAPGSTVSLEKFPDEDVIKGKRYLRSQYQKPIVASLFRAK
jgi:hypothetical protein